MGVKKGVFIAKILGLETLPKKRTQQHEGNQIYIAKPQFILLRIIESVKVGKEL